MTQTTINIRAQRYQAELDREFASYINGIEIDDDESELDCKTCGESGNPGVYPFSTNPNSGYCDDCR